jgi:formate dehydrogenase iron-sulfur subunit
LYNDLKPGPRAGGEAKPDGPAELAPDRWTVVQSFRVEKDGSRVRRFVKRQCFHCLDPACASACFAKALQKTPEGPVVYNEKLCVGCRYCMIACPFEVLRYEWDKPFPRVLKCQMCLARIANDQMPACVSACPTGALTFGDRDKIIAEARQRQYSRPDLYVSQIYGLTEAGGTSWLYLSDVPFERLGFPTGVPERPLPEYTWAVLRWTPHLFVGWGALLAVMYLYNRRRAVAHSEEEMYAPVDAEE